MSKRPAEDTTDGNEAFLKRQKISFQTQQQPVEKLKAADEIKSAKQLKQLLTFQQNSGQLRHAIQSFKVFLDKLSGDDNENGRQITILKEYLDLETQKGGEDTEKPIFLSDIMQMWEYASQSNNDSLLSAVPAVLALLLRTLSNLLELSKYGLRLSKTLLHKPQLELMERGLVASKTKEFVISPVLRLLRELTIFDGGVFAKQVFRARDHTLEGLARNLNIRYTGAGPEDMRKPSVRTNALRFMLPLLKFLPGDAKRDLLNQRDIVSVLTRDLREDPPFMVRDILETIKSYVMLDESLLRETKTKIINSTTLGRIVMLYQYEQADGEEGASEKKPVPELAHDFLVMACTALNMGLLIRQSGYYPRGVDPDEASGGDDEDSYIDLGLDSIDWMAKFGDKVPVRNVILSDFIQHLKPWSSMKQSELLGSIFKVAPELVADYFLLKKEFSFDPKLTATWMGYSAFIFATLQQPVPEYFGHQDKYARLPPPHMVVLENILPKALSQRVLTRCLSLPDNPLITFFVVRILSVALKKLQSILEMYQEASKGSYSSTWTRAATVLSDKVSQRCPGIGHVITAYRRMSKSDSIQREAVTRLLCLYYEIVPRIALEANTGAATAISEFMQSIENVSFESEDGALRALELENLFTFAYSSPGIRWCAKGKGLSTSPFTAMVKLAVGAPGELPLLKLKSVLNSIIQENQVLQTQSLFPALAAFVNVLKESPPSSSLYDFLDDCISRCAATPTKYIFALEELHSKLTADFETSAPVSLLLLTILEQWPFKVKTAAENTKEIKDMAHFINRYLVASAEIGENRNIMEMLTMSFIEGTPKGESRKIITGTIDALKTISTAEQPQPATDSKPERIRKTKSAKEPNVEKTDSASTPVEDPTALVRWLNKDVEEVIEEGHAASLVMLLSSNHLHIRKEASTNISKFALKLKESTFPEKEQIWMLLSEVNETARGIIDERPLPGTLAVFASRSISVLQDPLHCLFPKINKFLSQGPTWRLDKIPLLHKILDEGPTLDDAGNQERTWLLNYVHEALRSKADLDIYRRRLVFEKLLSCYNSHLGRGLQELVSKILGKATSIDGGSTALITRFSTLSWIQVQSALGGGVKMEDLAERILDSCDRKRVDVWSSGGIPAKTKSAR